MKVHGHLEIAGFEVVSSLPVTNLFTGREIFNSGDNKKYIYYSGTWNELQGSGGGGGGGGSVASVFGRTGTVTAQTNDYNADQIDDSSTTNKFATAAQLTAIATNTANIATNTSDIATNASAIAANTSAFTSRLISGNADVTITSIASGEILQYNGSIWINRTLAEAGVFSDPLTTRGDLVYRNASITTRLAIGTSGQYLGSNGTDPTWTSFDLTNSDINASAAIAYSKLALAGSILNADINASAAIAYSKLNLTGNILNADVNASAAIAHSKMAALTASRALVSDGSGVVSVAGVTATELEYLDGATSNIQTQLTNLSTLAVNLSISDWTDLTPAYADFANVSGGSLSVANSYLRWRREGDMMRVKGRYSYTGSVSGATTSFNFDTKILSALSLTLDIASSPPSILGFATYRISTSQEHIGPVSVYSGGLAYFFYSGSEIDANDLGAAPAIDKLDFDVWLPITEWSLSEALDPLTTNGDIVIYNSGITALGVGTEGQVLTVSSGIPSWQNSASGFSDPMSTRGDIIYRNSSNATARLGVGTSGQVLTSDGTDISWQTPSGGGSTALADLTDVTITSIASGELIVWNGSAYINNTLAEAGIQASLGFTPPANSLTLTAGEGLSGGGDLTTNRSFALALSELSTAAIATGDFVIFQDITDNSNKKATWTSLQSSISITESQISDFGSYAAASHSHAATDITSGTFANARISEASVTQHQAALSITESQISDLGSYISGITAEPLSDLSDVTITAIASSELLQWNGSAWINRTLAEAGIAASSHTHATTDIISGTFADARISQSSVTQHQAALSITESQISDLGSYISGITAEPLSDLSDVTITSIASSELLQWNGSAWINRTLAEAGIAAASHTHATTDITSGTFADARISQSSVTQHQAALSITESQISDLGSYGDVNGPGSSTDNAIARFDSTTGKIIQNSSATVDDSGNLSAANITASGQVASSINDAGNSGTSKTINWNDGNVQFVDMTGNVTFTFSNPVSGAAYTLILKQDATGSRTATWPAGVQWPGGTAPTLSTAANSIDVVTLVYNGLDTEYYANSVLDMQ